MKVFIKEPDRTIPVNIAKCKKPSMSDHRGRTWDHGYIWIDGEKIKAWLDTTWGDYIYFIYKEAWYKVRMYNANPFAGIRYDIDPFNEEGAQISTEDVKETKSI